MFHLIKVGELYPESITYSTRSCLGVMIIRIINNGKSVQSSKISLFNLEGNKRGPDVGYERIFLCAELRDGQFCKLVYLM